MNTYHILVPGMLGDFLDHEGFIDIKGNDCISHTYICFESASKIYLGAQSSYV